MLIRSRKQARGVVSVQLVIVMAVSLCGCVSRVDMPFNGEIQFHKISATVPESFIRDSTQSAEDLWIFEHGGYKEYILFSRQDAGADPVASLENYAAYLTEQGASAEVTTFSGRNAVHSTYTKDGKFCQEMLFWYEDSLYAVALRGGSEEAFSALLASVKLSASPSGNTI